LHNFNSLARSRCAFGAVEFSAPSTKGDGIAVRVLSRKTRVGIIQCVVLLGSMDFKFIRAKAGSRGGEGERRSADCQIQVHPPSMSDSNELLADFSIFFGFFCPEHSSSSGRTSTDETHK
jgi:hypothetical protein